MPRRSGCCRYPARPTLRIEVADPQHSLVLYGSPADTGRRTAGNGRSGKFVVPREARWWEPAAAPARYAYGPDWTSRLVFGRFPLEVVSPVMCRKMMLNITRLADRET
jgi:hypothetical protein